MQETDASIRNEREYHAIDKELYLNQETGPNALLECNQIQWLTKSGNFYHEQT